MSEIKQASMERRILAFIIDYLFLVLIATLAHLIFFINSENNGSGKLFVFFLFCLFFCFILFCFKDAFKGVSIGKWMNGIEIRDEHNLEIVPPLSRLFLRNLLFIIWPIEFVIFIKNNKRLGDKIAKTTVVKVKDVTIWRTIVAIIATILTSMILLIIIFVFSFTNSPAYKTAIAYIESNEEIIQKTGGIEGYGLLHSGEIHITNGYGESEFNIKVKGKTEDIRVEVSLTKEPKKAWVVDEIQYNE